MLSRIKYIPSFFYRHHNLEKSNFSNVILWNDLCVDFYTIIYYQAKKRKKKNITRIRKNEKQNIKTYRIEK